MDYLYDHYAPALYGVITRIIHEEDIAREVLQDVFLRIWGKIDQYDTKKGRLFTWMVNIARNLAVDTTRSKSFKQQSKTDGIEGHSINIDKKEKIEQQVDTIGLSDVLDRLDENQRFIIDMIYFKGYTHVEIADEYDIPLGTVKTRLRAAVTRLRKILA